MDDLLRGGRRHRGVLPLAGLLTPISGQHDSHHRQRIERAEHAAVATTAQPLQVERCAEDADHDRNRLRPRRAPQEADAGDQESGAGSGISQHIDRDYNSGESPHGKPPLRPNSVPRIESKRAGREIRHDELQGAENGEQHAGAPQGEGRAQCRGGRQARPAGPQDECRRGEQDGCRCELDIPRGRIERVPSAYVPAEFPVDGEKQLEQQRGEDGGRPGHADPRALPQHGRAEHDRNGRKQGVGKHGPGDAEISQAQPPEWPAQVRIVRAQDGEQKGKPREAEEDQDGSQPLRTVSTRRCARPRSSIRRCSIRIPAAPPRKR